MSEPRTDATSQKAYRVRVRPYRFVPGSSSREFMSSGWIKGFDTAAQAAEYMRKSTRLANHEVMATRPDGNGGRVWTTQSGLSNISRSEG